MAVGIGSIFGLEAAGPFPKSELVARPRKNSEPEELPPVLVAECHSRDRTGILLEVDPLDRKARALPDTGCGEAVRLLLGNGGPVLLSRVRGRSRGLCGAGCLAIVEDLGSTAERVAVRGRIAPGLAGLCVASDWPRRRTLLAEEDGLDRPDVCRVAKPARIRVRCIG